MPSEEGATVDGMSHPHTSAYSSGGMMGRAEPPVGADAEQGLRFGKYTVLERIGAGGMAEIFKCRLSGIGGFGKLVVVKRILPTNLAEPSFVSMFLDEARVSANLSHPNIVQTYEIDEIDGIPYIAMEYVRGLTFGALVEKLKPQPFERRVGIAAKVLAGACEGLHWAHHAVDDEGAPMQLIHRDVSPHNILVSVDGTPKLADFGVAKARGRLTETRVGTLKGKFMYMAPEQFQVESHIDHRVDVFSAGVCLYWAATGRLPYRGYSELEVIHAAARGQYRPPTEWVPELPAELNRIILWAMAPQPEARCPDSHQLSQALESFTSAGPYCTSAQDVAEAVQDLVGPDERSVSVRVSSSESSGPLRLRDLGLEMAARELGLPLEQEEAVELAPKAEEVDPRESPAFLSPESTNLGSAAMLRRWPVAVAVMTVAIAAFGWVRWTGHRVVPAPATVLPPIAASAPPSPSSATLSEEPAVVASPAMSDGPAVGEAAEAPTAPSAEGAESPSPASDAPTRTGTVSIVCEPEALVFVDGESWGLTPIVRRTVGEGTYQVELRKKGYVTEHRTLTVAFDEESQLSLRLYPPVSSLAPKAKRP